MVIWNNELFTTVFKNLDLLVYGDAVYTEHTRMWQFAHQLGKLHFCYNVTVETNKLICSSDNITYSKGYIALWCRNYKLPDTISVNGGRLFKKDHFHVSLLCIKNILKIKSDIEAEVLQHFCDFLKKNEIKFQGFTGEFRLAQNNGRKSVVALCSISNLHSFTDYLSKKIDIKIAYQPSHVTIYTLQPNMGIVLNSPKEMQEKSNPIDIPEQIKSVLS